MRYKSRPLGLMTFAIGEIKIEKNKKKWTQYRALG
jgi:hypothetical protein